MPPFFRRHRDCFAIYNDGSNYYAMKRSVSLLVWFMVACGPSSRITHAWKTQEQLPVQFDKLLVVCLEGNKDRNLRELMETHLADDLKQIGINAISSLQEYGPKEFRSMNEEELLSQLKNTGVDGVITIALLDKSKERQYVPGRVYYSPYVIYHRHFWGYYTTIYDRIYTPGYYTVNTTYFWESNLYDVSNKKLIASIQTESFDPGSTQNLAHEYGKLIVQYLVENKVLGKGEMVAGR
jgi:hypothetical protein